MHSLFTQLTMMINGRNVGNLHNECQRSRYWYKNAFCECVSNRLEETRWCLWIVRDKFHFFSLFSSLIFSRLCFKRLDSFNQLVENESRRLSAWDKWEAKRLKFIISISMRSSLFFSSLIKQKKENRIEKRFRTDLIFHFSLSQVSNKWFAFQFDVIDRNLMKYLKCTTTLNQKEELDIDNVGKQVCVQNRDAEYMKNKEDDRNQVQSNDTTMICRDSDKLDNDNRKVMEVHSLKFSLKVDWKDFQYEEASIVEKNSSIDHWLIEHVHLDNCSIIVDHRWKEWRKFLEQIDETTEVRSRSKWWENRSLVEELINRRELE